MMTNIKYFHLRQMYNLPPDLLGDIISITPVSHVVGKLYLDEVMRNKIEGLYQKRVVALVDQPTYFQQYQIDTLREKAKYLAAISSGFVPRSNMAFSTDTLRETGKYLSAISFRSNMVFSTAKFTEDALEAVDGCGLDFLKEYLDIPEIISIPDDCQGDKLKAMIAEVGDYLSSLYYTQLYRDDKYHLELRYGKLNMFVEGEYVTYSDVIESIMSITGGSSIENLEVTLGVYPAFSFDW